MRNIPIDGILGTNGEIATNSNGHKLKEFVSLNGLKITNTFSDIKWFIKWRGVPEVTDPL